MEQRLRQPRRSLPNFRIFEPNYARRPQSYGTRLESEIERVRVKVEAGSAAKESLKREDERSPGHADASQA